MGRTVPTITMFIEQARSGVFGGFVRSATPLEKRIINRLFARARNHLSAISMSGHILPFETILLAMQHEQQKQLNELELQIRRQR